MKSLFSKILIIFCTLLFVSQSAFANYVDREKYNPEDLTSFRVLTKQFQADFEDKKGTKEAEDAYLDVMNYYQDFVDLQNENIVLSRIFYYADDNYQKNRYSFYFLGLIMWFDEGSCFFVQSNRYIYENFVPYLTKEWEELIRYRVVYDDKRIMSDAHYLISKDEIRKIIKFYKDFSKKYPEFSKKYGIYDTIESFEYDLKRYAEIVY